MGSREPRRFRIDGKDAEGVEMMLLMASRPAFLTETLELRVVSPLADGTWPADGGGCGGGEAGACEGG
jgi:hypothetical protein